MHPELLVPCNTPKLVERVFSNEEIAGEILKHVVDKEPINDMEYRLISRAFNSEFLRMLRPHYKNIKISKPIEFSEQCTKIQMNAKVLTADRISEHISFLMDTANVNKVESLEIDRMYAIGDQYLFDFIRIAVIGFLIRGNRSTLKRVVGMNEICPDGCIDCVEIAPQCEEFGPMQFNVLMKAFKKPCHFKILHVNENLLLKIAVHCVESSDNREECMARLKEVLTPFIKADHLIIHMTAEPSYHECFELLFNHIPVFRRKEQFIPREVFDQMLSQWQVKSLKMIFAFNADFRIFPIKSAEWMEKEFFTAFQFNLPANSIENSRVNVALHLDSVEVESKQHRMSQQSQHVPGRNPSYHHLMSVVRKVFPSNRHVISYLYEPMFIFACVPTTLETVLDGYGSDRKNTYLKVRMFPKNLFKLPLKFQEMEKRDMFARLWDHDGLTVHMKRWMIFGECEVNETINDVQITGWRYSMKDSFNYEPNILDFEMYETSPWEIESD